MKRLTKNIHRKLFRRRSAFAQATIAALVIYVGDLLCVIGDLVWLAGDTTTNQHWYHWVVLSILSTAFVVIAISGIWLYSSINRFIKLYEKRHKKCKGVE